MIRRDGKILKAGKAGRIPLGVLENSNYIEKIFFHYYREFFGIPLFGQGSRAVESTNGTIWYGANSIYPNEIRGSAKRNTKRNNAIQKFIQDDPSLIL
jgi:hypothetical protein